jgi:hypothetical protein
MCSESSTFLPFSSQIKKRKMALSWNDDMDTLLIHNIDGQQVFQCTFGQRGEKWERVAACMKASSIPVEADGCKGRWKTIRKSFSTADVDDRNASGVETGEYTDRERLIQDLISLEDAGFLPSEKQKRADVLHAQGSELIKKQYERMTSPAFSSASRVSPVSTPEDCTGGALPPSAEKTDGFLKRIPRGKDTADALRRQTEDMVTIAKEQVIFHFHFACLILNLFFRQCEVLKAQSLAQQKYMEQQSMREDRKVAVKEEHLRLKKDCMERMALLEERKVLLEERKFAEELKRRGE